MADVPEPKPVEGWARERPLGVFGPTDIEEMIARHNAELEAAHAAQRRRALVSLALLALGAVALLVAVTALLNWAWGLLTFGTMCIIVSLLIGMDRSSSTSKKGQ